MVRLTQNQVDTLREGLVAIPSAFDQHSLETSSVEVLVRVLPGTSDGQARQILDKLRENGTIAPELVPRGGEDPKGQAQVRWRGAQI